MKPSMLIHISGSEGKLEPDSARRPQTQGNPQQRSKKRSVKANKHHGVVDKSFLAYGGKASKGRRQTDTVTAGSQ